MIHNSVYNLQLTTRLTTTLVVQLSLQLIKAVSNVLIYTQMWMTHGQVHFSQLPRVVKDHGYMAHPLALILPLLGVYYTTNK